MVEMVKKRWTRWWIWWWWNKLKKKEMVVLLEEKELLGKRGWQLGGRQPWVARVVTGHGSGRDGGRLLDVRENERVVKLKRVRKREEVERSEI